MVNDLLCKKANVLLDKHKQRVRENELEAQQKMMMMDLKEQLEKLDKKELSCSKSSDGTGTNRDIFTYD